MGFPGFLNTLGTLLGWSQTIKLVFKKLQKCLLASGSQGPRVLGPKTNENHLFLRTWKRCASKSCEGSTERQLQIIDMELF